MTSSQGIRGYIYLKATLKFTIFLIKVKFLSKIIAVLLLLAIRLFRMNVRIFNYEISCTHKARGIYFN
jgi:hypothetical protein